MEMMGNKNDVAVDFVVGFIITFVKPLWPLFPVCALIHQQYVQSPRCSNNSKRETHQCIVINYLCHSRNSYQKETSV